MEGLFDAFTTMTEALIETHHKQLLAVLEVHKAAMIMTLKEIRQQGPVEKTGPSVGKDKEEADEKDSMPIQKRKMDDMEDIWEKKSKPVVIELESPESSSSDYSSSSSSDEEVELEDSGDSDGSLAPEGDPKVYDADVIDQDYLRRAVEPIAKRPLRTRTKRVPFIKQSFPEENLRGNSVDITRRHHDDVEEGVDYFAPIEAELEEMKDFLQTLGQEGVTFWEAIDSSSWANGKLGGPLREIRANLGRDGSNQVAKDTFDKILNDPNLCSVTFCNPNKKGICIMCGLFRDCTQRFIFSDNLPKLIGSRCAELARALCRFSNYIYTIDINAPSPIKVLAEIDRFMKLIMTANEDKNKLHE